MRWIAAAILSFNVPNTPKSCDTHCSCSGSSWISIPFNNVRISRGSKEGVGLRSVYQYHRVEGTDGVANRHSARGYLNFEHPNFLREFGLREQEDFEQQSCCCKAKRMAFLKNHVTCPAIEPGSWLTVSLCIIVAVTFLPTSFFGRTKDIRRGVRNESLSGTSYMASTVISPDRTAITILI